MSGHNTLQPTSIRWRQMLLISGAVLVLVGLFVIINTKRLLPLIININISLIKEDWFIRLSFMGGELLIYGISIVIIALINWPRWILFTSWARPKTVLVIAIIIVILMWLPIMLFGRSAVIDGERYWWLFDDAMISMRYGRNVARGIGLVWNPSEYVEGYTNFLWTMYMALVHLLPLPSSKTSLVILLTNLALAIATIITIVRLVDALNGGLFVTVATVVSYIINRNIMTWAVEGLETTLLTFLLLVSIYRIIQDTRHAQPSLLTNFLIALLSLVRSDALVLSLLLFLMSILLHIDKKRALFYAGVSLCLPIMHLLFRWFYYHDLVPNTAYLKVFNWSQRFFAGSYYVWSFVTHYAVMIGFVIWEALRSKQLVKSYLLGLVALETLYIGYVGGDAFYNFRFFVPLLPILFILAFLGVKTFAFDYLHNSIDQPKRWTSIARIWLVAISCGVFSAMLAISNWLRIELWFFVVTVIGIVTWWAGRFIFSSLQSDSQFALDIRRQQTKLIGILSLLLCIGTMPIILPGYTTFLFPGKTKVLEEEFVKVGVFLRQNTPPDSKVAATAAGSIFYFSDRYGIDFLGKADRYIARLPVASDGLIPGHNKFDYDYSLGILKPDFVVADFAIPVTDEEMRQKAKGSTAFIGQLYFNRIFREHCLPYPIYVGERTTIVQCDWSPYFNDRIHQQESR